MHTGNTKELLLDIQWVTLKNRSDLVLIPNGLSDWQITRSDGSLD